MSLRRRANAPRLLDWSGERCVPWAPDIPVVYEHFHRYLWARGAVDGKRVLDVGSGEGFGSSILSEKAESVVGVDLSDDAVQHSRLNYSSQNLSFEVASATNLSGFADGQFDVVVFFEVIEHLTAKDQALAVGEIHRVLKEDGLLVMSTPDGAVTAASGRDENPFHLNELNLEELQSLLEPCFPSTHVYGQATIEGSRIDPVDDSRETASSLFQIERFGDLWEPVRPPAHTYFCVVASRSPGEAPLPASTLADFSLSYMRSFERKATLAEGEAKRAEQTQADLQGQVRGLQREVEESEREGRAWEEERARWEEERAQWEDERAQWGREQELRGDDLARAADEEEASHALARALQESQRYLRESQERTLETEMEAHRLAARIDQMETSITWRAAMRFKEAVKRVLGGEGSAAVAVSSWALRLFHRSVGNKSPASGAGPAETAYCDAEAPALSASIMLPTFEKPLVTIVIPTHNGVDRLTECLNSIVASARRASYEVIVVDDASEPATSRWLESVSGLRVIRNESNLGFLKSSQRGAEAARGDLIVFLNDDTEPQPGWLEALVDCVMSRDDVGAAGAKLLATDGSLQEAGGILWRDGSAWNFGRGDNPGEPQYSYRRSVDYCSGAALMVRREAWDQVGGFDERYAPAYCEDSDLCLALRDQGWEVLFEPQSVVIHHEGASMGTDVSQGLKRYQEINSKKLLEKWSGVLKSHPRAPNPDSPGPWTAYHASDWRRSRSVLLVDHQVPEPDRDSGSLRKFRMAQNLRDMGYRVAFIPDNGDVYSTYALDLQAEGVQVIPSNAREHITALSSSLDLIVLSRPYVAARYLHLCREFAPGVKIAYDTEDLHFLREARRAEHEGRSLNGLPRAYRHLEGAMASASDVTLVVSRNEGPIVEKLWGAETAIVSNANDIWANVPGPEKRSGVCFIGGFRHPPNVSAAIELALEIMPLVWQQLPDVPLYIVGSHPPAEILGLASSRVTVTGSVPSLDPFLAEVRLQAVPLRYGAGVKGKITQALGAGLPTVATAIAVDGMDLESGTEVLVADSAEDIATAITTLTQDDTLWNQLSAAGQARAENEYSQRAQREALAGLLRTLGKQVTGLTSTSSQRCRSVSRR